MAFKIRRKKNINVMRVGIKVGMTVLALYVSGFFITEIGNVVLNTSSAFYKGLSLIGWTVSNSMNGTNTNCGNIPVTPINDSSVNNCITNVNGAGVLAIVGVVAIAMLIFEFVDFNY